MNSDSKLTKTQKEFLECFPKSVLAECLSELYGFEEAFGDCTISETISIIMNEINRKEKKEEVNE